MNHMIPLQQAIDMTTLYRQQKENILQETYRGQNILPICESFDRTAFDTVLAQGGCAGIRIYYGMDAALKIHAVIVGVNEANEDMLPAASLTTTSDDDTSIIEEGNRCPDLCPPDSSLNS